MLNSSDKKPYCKEVNSFKTYNFKNLVKRKF